MTFEGMRAPALHSTLYTLHSTLYTLHSTLGKVQKIRVSRPPKRFQETIPEVVQQKKCSKRWLKHKYQNLFYWSCSGTRRM